MKNKGEILIETVFSSLIFVIVLLGNIYVIRNIHVIEKRQSNRLKDMTNLQNIIVEIKGYSSDKIKSLICDKCVFNNSSDFANYLGSYDYEINGEIFFDLYIDRGVAFISINNLKDFVLIEK
ncbi:hypothetical protein [Streptobacillus moniliformis]|uniref:hypothetical protein n=1 Tax=Streptobacillus moniliformis TaxID=34105 RepID=UPI0007E46D22|nr:hypothetical protein [Streptobacillus moniliformis]